ncbi:unnamed protein product [Trichobilharzia szidati]|nr:unnamed protein product [Trichobilharzia szidati]
MNGYSSFLVPTRFLVLLSHLMLCFCCILSDGRKSLRYGLLYSQLADEYFEYIISFSLSVIFVMLELCGFLSGATMFKNIQNIICKLLISLTIHSHFLSLLWHYTDSPLHHQKLENRLLLVWIWVYSLLSVIVRDLERHVKSLVQKQFVTQMIDRKYKDNFLKYK